MPKAINTVVVRILVFYVGSVLLLSLLLPYSAYQAGVSPVRHVLRLHRRSTASTRS